ncbi:hypothetical protein [Vulgatibacter sp.]|uniref:hypothetical protein n=1 Tax=Vulgatibacter sp. TaxID=1971226 RepID=UPI0035670000
MERLVRYLPLLVLLLGACGDISKYPEKVCASRGEFGCECGPRDTCKRGPDGELLACVAGTCELAVCDVGTPGGTGCLCGGSEACAAGNVCSNGRCEPDLGQTLVPPADPKCYTPCRGDLLRDGRLIVCGEDGLLEGCIDDAICLDGTCVVPRGEAGTAGDDDGDGIGTQRQNLDAGACSTDVDCPDFQSCIEGRCYSDCSADADCREGRICHRYACRLPCTTTNDTCPAGSVCTTEDGEAGVCLPVAPAAGDAAPANVGAFSLVESSVTFTSNAPTGAFHIRNDGAEYVEFVVRKAKHREFGEGGPKSFTDEPLFWLEMAAGDDEPAVVRELTVGVGPGETKEIRLAGGDNPALDRWDGTIDVQHPTSGVRSLYLSFARSPEGQWAGTMYYVANFPDGGLDAWLRNRDDRAALRAVGNAFIRRWGALREQRISLKEFLAALQAMQTESWKWDSVKARCPSESAPDVNVGCYLYDNNQGISVFSDYLPDNPIPTGVVDFPIAMNLRAEPGAPAGSWSGRILSSETLHYAGDPKIEVAFSADPNGCTDTMGDACLNFLEAFDADILVGGRYLTDERDTRCAGAAPGTFELTRVPWLVPGFEAGTSRDPSSNTLYRYECRDKLLPFGDSAAFHAINSSMAASNPIPDGATRQRSLELVDGAMIDQETIFVIFRERLPSFLDPADEEGFSSYGFMILNRTGALLRADDYEGFDPQDYRQRPVPQGLACDAGLVDTVLDPVGGGGLDATTASAVGIGVIRGVVPSPQPPPVIGPTSAEKVHYLCHDTGYFDGGADRSEPVACPGGSKVDFFTLQGTGASDGEIAALACQQGGATCNAGEPCEREGCVVGEACPTKGTCVQTLRQWQEQGRASLRLEPMWRCTDEDSVYCDADRFDLRSGKTFYREDAVAAVFRSLDDEIFEAFRYKTRFRNRTGQSVGFAPQVCQGDSIPYCYDPAAIEAIRERVDCATHVYTAYYPELTDEARSVLKAFLTRNFSYAEQQVFGLPAPIVLDGFERLYAELLIMMGDESFTSAFASRFDLAGQKLANFEGSLFEPQGLNLSGGAGFEMYSLYQAGQYYQLALDRFYGQAAEIWASIGELPPGQGFITQATTTSYFDRLIRASSQKARVWSEVAKRYQGFNRPDLARRVVERAYGQAYMESILLSQMMRKVSRNVDAASMAQITRSVEMAQYTYRAALLDMRSVYQDISDSMTFYGIPPDYIPFPALDALDVNAFEKSLARAREMASVAAVKEQRALEDNRSFETDTVLFQAELGRIRNDAENTLADICGTFVVEEDGQSAVYPAIPRYAYLSEATRLFPDPCGLVGNGALHDAMASLDAVRLDFEGVKLAQRNLVASIADAEEQVDRQCARIGSFKDYVMNANAERLRLEDGIRSLELVIDTTTNVLELLGNLTELTKCGPLTGECATAAVSASVYTGVAVGGNVLMAVSKSIIVGLEHRISEIENGIVEREIQEECDAARIDVEYTIRDFLRQAAELELEAVKMQYELKLAISQIAKLRNDATATMAEQAENEQLSINVEAARNDPNVRIYRNDAIFTADRTFYAALTEAYRATQVFEYYTSQSYAPKDKLFIVRMVAAGDVTLESYLDELESDYIAFEEQYGNPDTRVAIVSLRDDVLRIPRKGDDGVALSEVARTRLLREKLADPNLFDPRGYLLMPFSTSVDDLSPLTRNHKVRYAEAEIVGDAVGDTLGRVYVTQRGTGVVSAVGGGTNYYAFPVRTAVLNPFFNGVRALAPEVYRNERLRDRPLVNTGWDLVFNQKDERVNEDVDLASLTDIRLYVYYTDFTEI